MRNSQRGMVLVVSLVFLLVLTLLGLAAVQNTSLEERMAGNARAENEAFQAAEAGLRSGEAWLFAFAAQPEAIPSNPGTTNVWALDAPDPVPANDLAWWQEPARGASWWLGGGGIAYAGALLAGTGWSAPQPRYLVEQAGFVADSLVLGQQQDLSGRMFYQLTARGEATGGRGEVLLRGTYARRF